MPDVASFDDIAEEFEKRVRAIVWCTVATVDRAGKPRTRVLHPNWEGTTGWIATGRHSHKEKHLANNPNVSLSYWDQSQAIVYAECVAEWADDQATKQRIWDFFKSNPEPYGYDPAIIWKNGPDENFGVLKLTPSRIEIAGLAEQSRVWRA